MGIHGSPQHGIGTIVDSPECVGAISRKLGCLPGCPGRRNPLLGVFACDVHLAQADDALSLMSRGFRLGAAASRLGGALARVAELAEAGSDFTSPADRRALDRLCSLLERGRLDLLRNGQQVRLGIARNGRWQAAFGVRTARSLRTARRWRGVVRDAVEQKALSLLIDRTVAGEPWTALAAPPLLLGGADEDSGRLPAEALVAEGPLRGSLRYGRASGSVQHRRRAVPPRYEAELVSEHTAEALYERLEKWSSPAAEHAEKRRLYNRRAKESAAVDYADFDSSDLLFRREVRAGLAGLTPAGLRAKLTRVLLRLRDQAREEFEALQNARGMVSSRGYLTVEEVLSFTPPTADGEAARGLPEEERAFRTTLLAELSSVLRENQLLLRRSEGDRVVDHALRTALLRLGDGVPARWRGARTDPETRRDLVLFLLGPDGAAR